MSERLLPGVAARTAAEAARHAALGDEARAMLSDESAPGSYFDALTARGLLADGVRFLASALPKREAVWWSYRCALGAHGESPPAGVKAALDAVRRWVVEPDEPNRRAAEDAATSAGAGTPAGCSALAAFWSGGSLGPAGLETAIPPADHLTSRGVAGAVLLAAVVTEPERAAEKLRTYLALGADVAAGKDRWEPVPTAAPPTAGPSRPPVAEPALRRTARADRRPDTWE